MKTISIEKESFEYIVKVLNDRFLSITDLAELNQINQILRQLGAPTYGWLNGISPK